MAMIKKGVVVQCEHGTGPVTAVTKHWVIVQIDKEEVALHREDEPVWLPATGHEIGGGNEVAEIA